MIARSRRKGLGALVLAVALALAGCGSAGTASSGPTSSSTVPTSAPATPSSPTTRGTPGIPGTPSAPTTPSRPAPTGGPRGGTQIFGGDKVLVAYYGTAGTGSLGVLGETSPQEMQRRLARAAAPFARPGRPVQLVYELIVTVVDGIPGPDGDYSHDIARSAVQPYLDLARRNHALVVLDLQPGRSGFLDVARRWEWALRDPSVGLALDPEWRMHGQEVPGRVIGSVSAAEVNRASRWLAGLQRRDDLPEKLFVLHQFRTDMIPDVDDVVARPSLAMVQHVDGYGTPGQKLATYHNVARPRHFYLGFKLFYDEDIHRLSPADVLRIRPDVRFVSFQ